MRFAVRIGCYFPLCRNHPVQRFCCRLCRRTIERRFAWLARPAAAWHANRLDGALLAGPFQLDELESFEANRYQPLTVPVSIDRGSLFIVATAVGHLRHKGAMTPLQRSRRAAHERRHGRRPSHSAPAVRRPRPAAPRGRAGPEGGARLGFQAAVGLTNRTRTTEAQALELARRAYRPQEVLARRQDWGRFSPSLDA